MKNIVLVVVEGGVAHVHALSDTEVVVVDVDNIGSGDALPVIKKGIGFERLVEMAGVEAYVTFEK